MVTVVVSFSVELIATIGALCFLARNLTKYLLDAQQVVVLVGE